MSKVLANGDKFTYRLSSQYGDFGFLEKSNNKHFLLYYKLQNQNKRKSEFDRVIIMPTQFMGFEELPGRQYWKSEMYFYDRPFEYTFMANERNIATSRLFELDGENSVLEKKKSLDEWKIIYEHAKQISFLDDEYCRYKTNYYRSDLPLLKRLVTDQNAMCDKCVGFGCIPIYFGINVKTGRCFKCKGAGREQNDYLPGKNYT